MKQNQYLVPAAILAVVILIVAFKPNIESAWIQTSHSINVGMHIDEAVRRIGSPREIIRKESYKDYYDNGTKYIEKIEWVRTKSSPGKFTSSGYMAKDNQSTEDTYEFPHEVIFSDMYSARRQDPNMNKNDDEAWLIGNQWIFIDKNKIITSIGPSQYAVEK